MEGRVIEAMSYAARRFVQSVILPQAVGRSFLMQPKKARRAKDRTYYRSDHFWRDILNEKLGAERVVELKGVRLFEWFPRNPGLFHTRAAARAREEAERHLLRFDPHKYRAFQVLADAPPDHAALIRTLTSAEGPARTQIFTPRGKLSMLEGGIGCIRLQPALVENGGRAWFMSATSSTSPDEGVPLLVPDELYQTYIDRIRQNGFATVSIHGRTRFIPQRFLDLYAAKCGIPRLYVEVEEMEDAGYDEDYGLVSVASSFIAEFEGETSIYAAYVTFDPGHTGARAGAAQWLREEYVQGLYQGELLTDFDQQAPTISDTLFSLNEVLTSSDLALTIKRLRDLHGHFDWSMLEKRTINFTEHKEYVRMKIEANNNSGNQAFGGDNSLVKLIVHNADLPRLSQDLTQIIRELRQQSPSDDRDRMVGTLLEAKDAAGNGDAEATSSALKKLKPFASKVIDIGEKVGVGVAVAAVKAAMDF